MTFKKISLALIITLVTMNSFAAGCMSLKNSDWIGKLTLASGENIDVNLHIYNVNAVTNDQFKLSGTINNEPLTLSVGCIEQARESIRSIVIGSTSFYLTSHTLSPDHLNPVQFNNISGTYKMSALATTVNATSYLQRT